MILNTGQRTDIPAFYAEWFANRLKAGFVLVRNPYNIQQVTQYLLDPEVVDCIGFCTKNPAPMLPYMELLKPYGQFWYVTITPYGKEIEPLVPDKREVLKVFRRLSDQVGPDCMGWRYDPILINNEYTVERHLKAFSYMAKELAGYTRTAVISFIDLYQKTRRNFPEARSVPEEDRLLLGKAMTEIAGEHGMTLRPCAEGTEMEQFGADCSGCMKISDYEKAVGKKLNVPKRKGARAECACYLACDIGAYNTCRHLCKYCYANAEPEKVMAQSRLHDPKSPFLIGGSRPEDVVHEAEQKSWIDLQMRLEI